MKKLLILLVVIAMASLASATTISIIEPASGPGSAGTPLVAAETLRVYLGVSASDLDTLGVTVSATNATITGGVLASEAADYGVEVQDWGILTQEAGGFQPGLSFDTTIVLGAANIGLGQFGSTIYGATTEPVVALPVAMGDLGGAYPVIVTANTPLAYIDITAAGTGDILLSLVNGSNVASTSVLTDLVTVPTLTGGTIYAVPEPATMLILGLGALLLRRKK